VSRCKRRSKISPPNLSWSGDHVFATFAFPGGIHGVFESHRDWVVPGGDGVIMGLTVMGERGTLSLCFNDRAQQASDLRISSLT
jgi:predicted dehydrogenase